MKKIKAFSLVEIVVVMLLSAITMAFAYYIFENVNKYLISYSKMSSRNDELTEWFNYIKLQNLQSDEIHLNNRSIVFEKANGDKIKVLLTASGISRVSEKPFYSDTLSVQNPSINIRDNEYGDLYNIQFYLNDESIEWGFMKRKDLSKLYASGRD